VFYRTAALALSLTLISCSRRPAEPGASGIERVAILRFENLGADTANDWMGRAFSQAIIRDLAGVASVYAISFENLHSRDAAFGAQPVAAPGISAERSLALAAGAKRIGYGDYAVRAGTVEVRLTIEDPQTQKMVRVLTASGPADNVLEAADSLARALARDAVPYPTRNQPALEAYVKGLESTDAADRARYLEEAVTADPDFGPPSLLLAQLKALQQDPAGARGVLDDALSRKMPELENARLSFLAARLRGDAAAARQSLVRWSRASPNDPEVWTAMAADAMARHQYPQAVAANQKALAAEPDDITLLNQLGYSAAYAGQFDTAMSALQRYQALRPSDANPLDSMGDVNLLLGRLREAENFYLQAVKRDPSFLNGGDYFKAAMARLMSGDVAGADSLAKQFTDARAAAKDPLADFQRAEWSWIDGLRGEGYQQMQAFAENAAKGPARPAASEAYSQLAIWSVALGNRPRAAELAQKAAALSVPPVSSLAAIALFLAQPSAPASEWMLRAERLFPQAAQEHQRNVVLAYALLADKQFAEASKVLEPEFERTPVTADEDLQFLLAWADLESGKRAEAAVLLHFNPIPAATGVRPLSVFEFPRLFYLRGRLAAASGNHEQAQADYRLFRKLSGDEPLMWGEEAAAKQ
jgi:tetratricopeptide (TPR) repeat protein